MGRVSATLLPAMFLAAFLSTPAAAASFVKYTFTGQFAGTRTIQPANAMGRLESVVGTASFEYVIPLNVIATMGESTNNAAVFSASSGYFLGARGEWSARDNVISFFERGFGNAGVANYIFASACLPTTSTSITAYSGSVDSGCSAAIIRDTERGTALDLQGNISSFSAQIMENGAPLTGLNSYSFTIGAIPEPSTWAMLVCGFGMMGAAIRSRRRVTKLSFA